MNNVINALMGLITGYTVGIILAVVVAFIFGLDAAARFVAIGCGFLGAVLGPSLFGPLRDEPR